MQTSTQIQQIQNAADQSLNAVYASAEGSPEFISARNAYDGHVESLVALLGEDAHCSVVDPDLFQFYYYAFAEEFGYKPRGGHITRSGVTAWLDARRDDNGFILTLAEIEGRKSREIQAEILNNGIGAKGPSAMAIALQGAGVA